MADTSRFETAADVINSVAVEVGLSKNAAPFSSPDPAFKQLITLLTVSGRLLAVKPVWNSSIRTATFTVTGASEYDLPVDFFSLTSSTMYDRSSNFPIYGSANQQMWNVWLTQNPSVTFSALFRLANRKLSLFPNSLAVGTEVSYEYRSRAWVLSASGTRYKDFVENPGDFVLFEPILISRLLRYKFLQAKGFDTKAAYFELTQVFEEVKSSDSPAEVLSLIARPMGSRFLDSSNVPETGFG